MTPDRFMYCVTPRQYEEMIAAGVFKGDPKFWPVVVVGKLPAPSSHTPAERERYDLG